MSCETSSRARRSFSYTSILPAEHRKPPRSCVLRTAARSLVTCKSSKPARARWRNGLMMATPMKVDLSDEDAARIVRALETYAAYLNSQQRTDPAYLEL